jgi:ABC-type bacteriocin/lantibiotic exporter with double-glycine peptidase domain
LLYLVNLITIGQIFTLHSYSIHLAAHLRRVIELDIILKDIKTSIERINIFLLSFEREDDIEKIDCCVESIIFKNVKFRYDDSPVFNNVNFLAEKGDIISIGGPNGVGKSTLATIITGLQYDQGEIYYNDFKNVSANVSIRDRVAIVDQTSYLFPDTILNNLTCFDETRVDLAIRIIDKLNITSRFENFRNGLDTIISEENENLSGGEKQLISILRALISDRDIIVLDEFTSSLDTGLKKDLLRDLRGFLENKITFVISHDDETQSMCTKHIELTKYESA